MQQFPRQPGFTPDPRSMPIDAIDQQPTTTTPAPQAPLEALFVDGRRALLIKEAIPVRHIIPLCIFILVLEVLYVKLDLLLALPTRAGDTLLPALTTPWLSRYFSIMARIPWPGPSEMLSQANLALITLVLVLAIVVLAAAYCRPLANRAGGRNSRTTSILPGSAILLPALLFTATMVVTPVLDTSMTQHMLLAGYYGHMIVSDHMNPYVTAPALFPQDALRTAIVQGGSSSLPAPTLYGPLWLDMSVVVASFTGTNLAHVIAGFRGIGALAHMANCVIIWVLLTKWQPRMRVPATLLYGWNPLVLLLGISQMHLEVVIVLLLLLATLFFLRGSTMVGWVFLVLTALMNPFYALLLPLFARLLIRRAQLLSTGHRVLWWINVLLLSGLVAVLAYAPYWEGWGVQGFLASIQQIFWPTAASNSLVATLQYVPLQLPKPLLWIVQQHNWLLLLTGTMGVFLLFACWLTATLEVAILCSAWLLLIPIMAYPTYWPWYMIPPLVLALCSLSRGTIVLALLLVAGALVAYYYCLWLPGWPWPAFLTIGIPLLLWGWLQFFQTTWSMFHKPEEGDKRTSPRFKHITRPPWRSRAG